MQKFLEGNITTEGDCRGWFDESSAMGHSPNSLPHHTSVSASKVRGQSSVDNHYSTINCLHTHMQNSYYIVWVCIACCKIRLTHNIAINGGTRVPAISRKDIPGSMVLVGGYTELYKTEATSVAAVCRMLWAANITPERRDMAAVGESSWVVYVCMFRSDALCIMNIRRYSTAPL